MPETIIIETKEIKNPIQPVSNPKCNRIIVSTDMLHLVLGKNVRYLFVVGKIVDITPKTAQKKRIHAVMNPSSLQLIMDIFL